MSPRANVRSLDAIRQFRPAVVRFEDDVMAALTGLRTELNRTMQWLDHDCPAHWQNQIRLGFDHVNEARTQLSRKQMMTIGGRHPDCIEEKKALVRTKQQLETAQEKLKLCRQWSIKAHRAADEYQSRLGRAEQAILQGIPRMMAILERVVMALEQYTATERPSRSEPLVFDTTTASPAKSEAAGTDEPPQSVEPAANPEPAKSEAVNSLTDDLTEVP
ncbi:MAG TPA: hypothetical protein VHX68_09710 [Planctomycetaceae bacterium]|nr:hypothetical protein [Planctomycetaceae bacterium]